MEKILLKYKARGQMLTAPTPPFVYASNTVNYLKAEFDLDDTWSNDFDSVMAIWQSDYSKIATLLDADGTCTIPQEVLSRVSPVKVNLVGSRTVNSSIERLTTFSVIALEVVSKANIDGAAAHITPTEFEQFVEEVSDLKDATVSAKNTAVSAKNDAVTAKNLAEGYKDDALTAKNQAVSAKESAEAAWENLSSASAEASTLSAGSDATASYSNGLFSFGIPRGDKGDTGEKGDPGDKGDPGSTGATGNGIASIAKTSTSGLVDTYTVTYTDGTTTTFTVTNGQDGSLAPSVLAQNYSASQTYAVGDYCYYSGTLYRCITAITTAEAWTAAHWTQVALADDVTDLKSALEDKADISVETKLQKVTSENPFYSWTLGYMYIDGTIYETSDRMYSNKVDVSGYNVGDTLYFWTGKSLGHYSRASKRAVCAFDANGNVYQAGGDADVNSSYTIKDGVKSIIVTLYITNPDVGVFFLVNDNTSSPTYPGDGFPPYYEATDDFIANTTAAKRVSLNHDLFELESLPIVVSGRQYYAAGGSYGYCAWPLNSVIYDNARNKISVFYCSRETHASLNGVWLCKQLDLTTGEWSEPILVAGEPSDNKACYSGFAVAMLDNGNYIGISKSSFLGRLQDAQGFWHETPIYKCVSTDGGLTWSKSKIQINGNDVVGDDPCSLIKTNTGRYMCYVGGDNTESEKYILYSDDNCETWSKSVITGLLNDPFEGTLVQLSDGTICLIVRQSVSGNNIGYPVLLTSVDNGENWSQPVSLNGINSVGTPVTLFRDNVLQTSYIFAISRHIENGYCDLGIYAARDDELKSGKVRHIKTVFNRTTASDTEKPNFGYGSVCLDDSNNVWWFFYDSKFDSSLTGKPKIGYCKLKYNKNVNF